MKNAFVRIAAALMAAALATAFTACKSDDDDDDVSTVATYVSETVPTRGGTGKYTVTFYDDETFTFHFGASQTVYGYTFKFDLITFSGTYTGNPAADGTVTLTMTKIVDGSYNTAAAVEKMEAEGSTTYTFTNDDFPLESVSADEQESEELTISNGKCTWNGAEYTRQ